MADFSSRRIRSTALAARACTNCRKRKSRCNGSVIDGRRCTYCAKTGKECSFEEPADRTPLTRKNLDAAERRCTQLKSLLQSLNPDLDIEAALAKLEVSPSDANGYGNDSTGSWPGSDPANAQQADDSSQDEGDETEEARYGWQEDFCPDSVGPRDDASSADARDTEPKEDGMGTFSTSDSGYLGSSSASSLLQDIASLLPSSNIAGATAASMYPSARGRSSSSPRAIRLSSSPRISQVFDRPDLASSAATNLLIDSYFLFYNTSYPIVHEKSFRTKAATDWPKSKKQSAWSIVYYMVLAIGHYVSVASSTPRAPSPFFIAARSRMSINMLESASLETLQAFLLMGNYLQKMGRPNTGYNLIGIACRIAFGLGLHREPPNAVNNMLHERRRQLFWTVYCFDSGFNITTGRPPTVTEGFIDVKLPRNVDDKDCSLTTGTVNVVEYPTPYSAIIAQAQLAQIADAIYKDFLRAKTAGSKIPHQVADGFERNLSAWRQHLPQYFVSADVPSWFLGPRAVVLWKFQNLRILLWRGVEKMHPFLPTKPDASRRCIDSAVQAVHEIASFCGEFEEILHLGINWYATYFLFQATLVLEVGRLSDELRDEVDQELLQTSIARSRTCLGILAKKSSSVNRFLEVLDKIHIHNFPVLSVPSHNTVGLDFDSQQNSCVPPQAVTTMQDESYLLSEVFGSLPGSHHQSYLDALGFSPGEAVSDPTLQMLIEQMPLDFFDQQARGFFGL